MMYPLLLVLILLEDAEDLLIDEDPDEEAASALLDLPTMTLKDGGELVNLTTLGVEPALDLLQSTQDLVVVGQTLVPLALQLLTHDTAHVLNQITSGLFTGHQYSLNMSRESRDGPAPDLLRRTPVESVLVVPGPARSIRQYLLGRNKGRELIGLTSSIGMVNLAQLTVSVPDRPLRSVAADTKNIVGVEFAAHLDHSGHQLGYQYSVTGSNHHPRLIIWPGA